MESIVITTNNIELPYLEGEWPMYPFSLNNLNTLAGFKNVARQMLNGVIHNGGVAYFTFHGKILKKGETLRRGGPHTDGNYEPMNMDFARGGGNGWKVGENGPSVNSDLHRRQYLSDKGGILIASNYESCLGWSGDYKGTPGVGGDCNKVYYGNNHFIHESLPVDADIHRVMARITMPENHRFMGVVL